MGTWSPTLYGDDTALDLRLEWSYQLRWGGTIDAITRALSANYGAAEPILWFVLADLQWRSGHLLPRVRDRALKLLSPTSAAFRDDVAAFNDPLVRRRRAAVLAELRARLRSRPPPPKRRPRPRGVATTMKRGEFYAWRTFHNRLAFFQVVGFVDDVGAGRAAALRVLDLVADRVPSVAKLAALPSRKTRKRHPISEGEDPLFRAHPRIALGVFGPDEYPAHRLTRVGSAPIPAGVGDRPSALGAPWSHIDRLLERELGIGWPDGAVLAWPRAGEPPALLLLARAETVFGPPERAYHFGFELLAWSKRRLPTPAELPALRPITLPDPTVVLSHTVWVAGLPPAGKLQHLGTLRRAHPRPTGHIYRWEDLDRAITERLAKAG